MQTARLNHLDFSLLFAWDSSFLIWSWRVLNSAWSESMRILECWSRGLFPPESIGAFDVSKSREIAFITDTTDLRFGERIRPLGAISLCLKRPAHRPKDEAIHKFLGCLFHRTELAGSSSLEARTLTSSGKTWNTAFLTKSTGLVPPHSSFVRTYQFLWTSRDALVTRARRKQLNSDGTGEECSSSIPVVWMDTKYNALCFWNLNFPPE